MEAGVGGRFYQRDETGEEARLGEVTRWDPPARVTYTWYPGAIEGPTEVDVQFSRDGEHTLVDVTHAEGDSQMGTAWTGRAKKFDRAWDDVLPAFAEFVTTEQGA
jgi:hypothetical protein